MASRLLDTLYFYAEGITGLVYYDDGGSNPAQRRVYVSYTKGGVPSAPPASENQPFTGSRNGQVGQPLVTPFCEDTTLVTLTASANNPFATLKTDANATQCNRAGVVCDLVLKLTTQGTQINLSVTTSNGPWESSQDGVNFYPNQATYFDQVGKSGRITVRDAGQCYQAANYTIANPGNPQPAGQLIDQFTYVAGNASTQVEIYGLYEAPYTIAAWSRAGVPLPGNLTPEQRGHPDGYELHPRCAGAQGTTLVQLFATLQPPYARIVVTEDSPVCGYVAPPPPSGPFRFTYVRALPESNTGGDGVIQAAVEGNDGPVLFSLDNYKTPGQASGTFKNLFAGSYIIYARETKVGGRTIWQRIEVPGPAYGLRYRLPYKSKDGATCVSNLYLRGYVGPVETLRSEKGGHVVEWVAASGDGHFFDQLLRASQGTLHIKALSGNRLEDLDLGDERQMRLEMLRDGQLQWIGWVLPDLYEVPHLARPYPITVRATDGLGALKDVPFTDALGNPYTGELSHWDILRSLFARLAVPLPWAVLHKLYPEGITATADTEPLQLVATEAAGFAESDGKPWACDKVLQAILDYHGLRVHQWGGAWYFERLADLLPAAQPYRWYDAAGAPVPAADVNLLRVVQLPPRLRDTPERYWQGGRQLLSRQPAVAGVTITAEPGEAYNFFPDGDFPATSFDATSGKLLGWKGQAEYTREPDPNDVDKPASLRLKQTGVSTGYYLDSPTFLVPVAGLSLVTPIGGPAGYYAFQCTLTFTVRLAQGSFTPDPSQLLAAFYVSFGVRDPYSTLPDPIWFYRADVQPGQPAPTKIPVYELTGTGATQVSIPFAGSYIAGYTPTRYEATVRVYAPSLAGEVLLSDIQVTVGTPTNGSYVSESNGLTAASARLTRRDEGLKLQLADSLNPDDLVFSRLDRSVFFAATGQPLGRWREGLDPAAPLYYSIDLLVRDRLRWQTAPCWVLRGLLRGDYAPGALVVDPGFDAQVAFVTTAALWDMTADTWELTAVQGLSYHPDLPQTPYCFLAEDGTKLLSEDLTDAYLLAPEDAY